MTNKLLIFFFIFFLLLQAPVCYSLNSNNNPSVQNPSFNITIKRNSADSKDEPYYLFECRIQDKFWNDRVINLYLEGSLKKNEHVTIIDVHSGHISLNPTYIEDFSFYAVYKNKLLTITYLKTKEFILKGGINFSGFPYLDLALDIKGLSLKELNKLWGIEDFPFQGDFRGKITITGKTDAPLIRGTLQAYQANLEGYEFKEVLLNFRGIYPWVHFFDSLAIIRGSNFEIEGALNLSKLYHLPCGEGKMQTEKTHLANLNFPQNSNKKEASSLRGFLTLPQKSNALLYKLGTDSYLRLTVKDNTSSLMERKMEF